MSNAEHNSTECVQECAARQAPHSDVASIAPKLGAAASLRLHWPEYLMEAVLLGSFMVSACLFAALFYFPESPVSQIIPAGMLRRMLIGVAMALTAMAIFYSPWGKQSGAHINPSVTLTFFRLGRIRRWDAFFYILAQFAGAFLGVLLAAGFLRSVISHPSVRYAVTTPGFMGPWAAFAAEILIAWGMMLSVLYFSSHPRLSRFTPIAASILVATYITFEAPLSGMSMNPARSFGSALNAGVWDHFWIYMIAPLIGMLGASQFYLWWKGREALKCCKLHHHNLKRCIFCGANGGFAS